MNIEAWLKRMKLEELVRLANVLDVPNAKWMTRAQLIAAFETCGKEATRKSINLLWPRSKRWIRAGGFAVFVVVLVLAGWYWPVPKERTEAIRERYTGGMPLTFVIHFAPYWLPL